MTPITVLYHAHCPDGRAAAFACWQVFGENAVYVPVAYGRPCPAIPPEHNVYIVDFSYDAETLRRLLAVRIGRRQREEQVVVVLDHHVSAECDLTSLMRQQLPGLTIRFDIKESGASLAWKYLNRAPTDDQERAEAAMPTFYKYIRDRDLWQFALPESKAISMAYRTIMMRPFIDLEQFAQDLDDAEGHARLVADGQAMLRYAETLVADQSSKVQWATIGGYTIPCANATALFSEVGEALCRQYPDAPFAAYFALRSDGQVQWGLRGKGRLDLSAIAQQYGGGGHPDAAGMVTPRAALEIMLLPQEETAV